MAIASRFVIVFLLFLLVLLIGGVFLQIFLSKRESRWPGLVLPLLVFLQSLLLPLNLRDTGSVSQNVLTVLVTLLAAFNIFQICCPGLMFRWSIMWHVQDPCAAEPSDWYILMERIEWVVLTGVVAVLYWAALTVID